jgi:protoheme IX farnesyltransferase
VSQARQADGTLAAAAPAPLGPARSVATGLAAALSDYVALMKPGIVLLLLVTEFCAMWVAAHGLPPAGTLTVGLGGLLLSSGGANAVNMWYDQDIDRVMQRTMRRPVPAGRMPAERALLFGLACEVASFALLWHFANPLAALLSLAGFVYYVGVYTMWLKRRTPQNIVIGGGAGAFPPLVGWAAVTGGLALAPALMFLVIFLWTPPHFWSLALYRQEDYRRAGIPMMPVARGERPTKVQSFMYAMATLVASSALYWTHAVATWYLLVAVPVGLAFVVFTALSLRERLPEVAWAKRTFRFSLAYLAVVFGAMVLSVPGFGRG